MTFAGHLPPALVEGRAYRLVGTRDRPHFRLDVDTNQPPGRPVCC